MAILVDLPKYNIDPIVDDKKVEDGGTKKEAPRRNRNEKEDRTTLLYVHKNKDSSTAPESKQERSDRTEAHHTYTRLPGNEDTKT